MPLFECSKCHAVDNTACTNFIWDHCHGELPLCSECDPEIAKWHGLFPKLTLKEYRAKHPNALAVEYPLEGNAA